jgi:cytochrome b involved in lipid metabolism
MSKTFTPAEVAQYKTEEKGIYLIIDQGVYDVTSKPSPPTLPRLSLARSIGTNDAIEFLDDHPGGPKILKRMAGKDSSKQFWKYNGKNVLDKYGAKLKVGEVKETAKL